MKVYVSVDMEGIAGIVLREQLKRGESLYEEARHLLTKEVNIVVESLLAEGATEIIVKDAHGSGFNFLVDQLHPQATYCFGALKVNQRFPGLDTSFDAALLIGYHAKGGEEKAFSDHTMTSRGWQSVSLNGKQIGEIGLDSLLFGLHDVPVIMVSGDDKTCREAHDELGPIVTYETKQAFGRHAGLLKPPQRVYKEISEAIGNAIKRRSTCKPYKLEGPYELTLKFLNTADADARYYDEINSFRVNGLEARYVDDDLMNLIGRSM